jgi:hypothetical protein
MDFCGDKRDEAIMGAVQRLRCAAGAWKSSFTLSLRKSAGAKAEKQALCCHPTQADCNPLKTQDAASCGVPDG